MASKYKILGKTNENIGMLRYGLSNKNAATGLKTGKNYAIRRGAGL